MRRHHGTCHERARQTEGFGIAVAEPSHGINARWTMISLLRTDEVAVDGIPAGRGLAQARWTIKRGFQLGLVDGMTGDRPVLTDHARCALEHLLSKVSKYFLKFIVDHDGGKSADGAGSTAAGVFSGIEGWLYFSKFSRPSAQVHKQ